MQRHVAHVLPQADLVLEVALDLLLGACRAGGADDEPHALGHLELVGDGLEALAVLRLRDLARDAAAAARVGHQHGVAAGERQIGGEGRALAAALLLDDLHQDDLAALDHLLDLVGAHPPAGALGHLLQGVLGAHLLDRADGLGRLGLIAADFLDVAVSAGLGRRLAIAVGVARRGRERMRVGRLGGRLRGAAASPRVRVGAGSCRRSSASAASAACCRAPLGGSSGWSSRGAARAAWRSLLGRGRPRLLGLRAGVGFGFGLGFRLGLLRQQRLPVGDRDLVVVGMDFAEGQEAVAVAAVVDEGRLQRRLDARHLGEIDIAAQEFARGRLRSRTPLPGRCGAPRPESPRDAWHR